MANRIPSIQDKFYRVSNTELRQMHEDMQVFIQSRCWLWLDDYCHAYEEALGLDSAILDELSNRGICMGDKVIGEDDSDE